VPVFRSLKSILKNVRLISSKALGIIYVFLMPAMALVYFCTGTIGEDIDYISSLYFSVVTQTTLGYGDILPNGQLGRIFAILQSVLGVVLIGFFLAATSREWSEAFQAAELERSNRLYRNRQYARIMGNLHPLVDIVIEYQMLSSRFFRGLQEYGAIQNSRNREEIVSIPNEFPKREKLLDVFRPSMIPSQPIDRGAVFCLIDSEERLLDMLSKLVLSVDLSVNPKLQSVVLEIIRAYPSFVYRQEILEAERNEAMKGIVISVLSSLETIESSMPGNVINPYLQLAHSTLKRAILVKELMVILHSDQVLGKELLD